MEHIVKSLNPVVVLATAAVVFVLGTAFLLASDAMLASSVGASSDLAQAGRWIQFLAGAAAMGAVCAAGWEVIVRSQWAAGAEIAAAALGTLLLMIGLLAAAASNGSSTAGPVTSAVGIGIWALLVLSRAARASLAETGPAARVAGTAVPAGHGGQGRQADLWLAAAVGLFVLAIGYGFTSAASEGAGIAAGILQAVGVVVLAGSLASARSRGLLRTRPVPGVITGLVLLAVSFLAAAVVAGLSFGTLTALGAGLTVVTAVELAAIVALGLAAWTRVRELYPSARPVPASP